MREDERKIAKKLVTHAIQEGYSVSLWDEEGQSVEPTTTVDRIMGEVGATCFQFVGIHQMDAGRTVFGNVNLVFGNEPGVLIADHSNRLTAFLEPVMEYARGFEE